MRIEPYYEPITPIKRLLSLLVRGGLTQGESQELQILFQKIGALDLQKEALRNKVEALVLNSLCRTLPSNDVKLGWKRLTKVNERRVLCLQEAWKAIASRLTHIGCRHALVENAGVMYGSDLPLAAFCAGDFDILVESGGLEETKKVFEDEGFTLADRRNRPPTNKIEYCRESANGCETIWLNVGVKAFDRIWVPLKVKDREPAWLSRTCPSRKVPSIMILSPVDALALVSMHTSCHFYIRSPGIRLHVDVDRLVRDNCIDWEAYIAEVIAMNIPTRAFVSLSMAVGLLGTPVPVSVLKRLYPGDKCWLSIRRLLVGDSVFATGKNKLRNMKDVYLDYSVNEGNSIAWLKNILFPSREWLIEHFTRDGVFRGPNWVLHMRRIAQRIRLSDYE
jgi:hypothetical protein